MLGIDDKKYFLVSYPNDSDPFWATEKQLSLKKQEEFYTSLKDKDLNRNSRELIILIS
jgi:hypothetical protein